MKLMWLGSSTRRVVQSIRNAPQRGLLLCLSFILATLLGWTAWGEPLKAANDTPGAAGPGLQATQDSVAPKSSSQSKPIIPPEGSYDGKAVEQPIEFPHDIHTKVNKINCLYCHTYGRRSKVAGIPPTSKCMGCHRVIATDKPRIQKLTEYWEKKQSVPWKKVHDVPDFVHFTHERHLKKFIFDKPEIAENLSVDTVAPVCAYCHGDLRTMTVARKVKPMTMGWCVACHQANDGPSDCWKCHK